jgi:hypothetical protein
MKIRYLLNTLGQLGMGVLFSLMVQADEPATSERVPIPNPPKAKQHFSAEQACVEPLEIIRRNHGQFLKHQRDQTMHNGVRTQSHSLVECINCHVTPDDKGNYPSLHEGTQHFCRSCHAYAAVTIDCFQCHASKPEQTTASQ